MTNVQRQALEQRRLKANIARDNAKLNRELITPEGALLNLKLASGSERAGAFLIDLILIIVILIASFFIAGFIASGFGYQGDNIVGALLMVFIFFLRNFYFISFEIGKRAATPGKRLLGLRVAARNGGRLTASAVFARNFTREVECFMPIILLLIAGSEQGVNGMINLLGLVWTGLFLFFPLMNADKLRAGDIIAGTWVIHAPKIMLHKDISGAGKSPTARKDLEGFNFTLEQVDAYGIRELHVLEDVLRQSSPDVKASVASRIREKIKWQRAPGERDRAFLEAYYAALRKHLEQKLLLGKRKADKFDKS